jgi:hypothetical protein
VADANLFAVIVRKLEKLYGRPKPPKITDPLEIILLENVAYLADDEKRAAAFAELKKTIGTRWTAVEKIRPHPFSLDTLPANEKSPAAAPELHLSQARSGLSEIDWIISQAPGPGSCLEASEVVAADYPQ